jgi:TPR repeat protein
MYGTGQGVPQDCVEAHKWHNLAASHFTSDEQKQDLVANAYALVDADALDALAKLMTPAQLAEAQRRAREWQAAFDARQE